MNDNVTTAIDTLCSAICKGNTIFITKPADSWLSTTITVGDILAILGMIGSIAVFWWQLYKSRKENRENLRSTWFLEVIVEPNMPMITSFYTSIISKIDSAVSDLHDKYSQNWGVQDLNKELAKYQREIKDQIKSSLGQFLVLLKASEPDVAYEVQNVLDSLIDIATEFTDKYEEYNGRDSISTDVLRNKQALVSKLYKGWNKVA